MKNLARDTAINVLANLLAAAIIYLIGVFAGLFPSGQAVEFAVSFLVTAASFGLFGIYRRWRNEILGALDVAIETLRLIDKGERAGRVLERERERAHRESARRARLHRDSVRKFQQLKGRRRRRSMLHV